MIKKPKNALKKLVLIFLFSCSLTAKATTRDDEHYLKIDSTRTGNEYQITASFRTTLSTCQAFAFITDYEGVKEVPGVVESKIISRDKNRVLVALTVKEKILFLPVKVSSILEVIESPPNSSRHTQISGDNKYYNASWIIQNAGSSNVIRYESSFDPGTIVPNFLIESFIKNSSTERFQKIAIQAESAKYKHLVCDK